MRTATTVSQPFLSIVLPCYNEQDCVDFVLNNLLAEQERLIQSQLISDFEILVVNDGSLDQTVQRLSSYVSNPRLRLLSWPKNRGYGYALKAGFASARGDWLAFYDFDGTCQAQDLLPMMRVLQKHGGMVCGNRLSSLSQMPTSRRIGNWLYLQTTRALSKVLNPRVQARTIADCCTGYRVFEAKYKEPFCRWLPDKLNFSLAMTVLYLRIGDQYQEVPIHYAERLGQSKLRIWSDGPRFLITLLVYTIMPRFTRQKI